MDRSKINTLYHTIKYLKPIQIYYRLFYFARNCFFKKSFEKELNIKKDETLYWKDTLLNNNSFTEKTKFNFLNIEKDFKQDIDWNFEEFGLLWAFNINYFDFLNQQAIDVKDGIRLIKDYIAKDSLLTVGKASYPISLRGINWVKFLIKNKISDKEIDQYLYNDYQILFYNPEYQFLGNHLLENGFSLLFGAYYFKDELLYKQAVKILKAELKEQVLADGGHFELSPMYHQIMLLRLLDCIQLLQLNVWKEDDLLLFLENTASKMQAWLKEVTFENGDIPMVNDSSYGIAPKTSVLLDYGRYLELKIQQVTLSDSGYRKLKGKDFELFIDVGNVGASYQPAHAHSDTFNFVLHNKNQPIIVDTGTSTYEKNGLRQNERCTASHNTVQIGKQEQTEVWDGFRVAKRAKIIKRIEKPNSVQATHDGYVNLGIFHSRKFAANRDEVKITDIISEDKEVDGVAYFHFHPDIQKIEINENRVNLLNQKIEMVFEGSSIKIEKESYQCAQGYNTTIDAHKICVSFNSKLETSIHL